MTRPATEPYRLCSSTSARGVYSIEPNAGPVGSFRSWLTTPSGVEIYLGDRASHREALALCEGDRSWGLERA